MRPRINKFGKVSYHEINDYLTNNYVYGFTIKKSYNSLLYLYKMMFRSNKDKPETLFVEASKTSKLVINAWTNKGIKFNNIEELKKYTSKTW